ncbi:MAG: DNA polymerase III subunit gamma/tau, partial [Byssovorax sp.]
STTIGNAIAQNRVAHAFLFTGVRGVGKTTSARILAKALNCATGPTATPCQVCPQCVEITAGRDMDVQEIDGASYTGVDDVRRLQSNLGPQPSRDRFKIFIVDEVHMLSNNAWNAFLKTLEEPPPHVKFIFATTEVHKVPITILSRCQRYDFKMITAQRIAGRMRFVLDQEKIGAEDGAISAVAREAAGSMRDAMSLLDQVIAWVGPGEKLTAEGVARVLGIADRVVLHRLAEAVLDGNAGEAVRIVGDLAREGYDLPHVARDFLSHLRDLVIAKVSDDPAPLLDLADEEIGDVKALAARSSVDDLTRLHQGFSKSFDDVVRSGQPRASLEMTLVRLARRPPLLPVDELLRRLGDLERRLGGGGGGGPAGSPGAPQNRGPAPGGSGGGGPAPGGGQRRQYGGAGATNEAAPSAPVEPPPVAAAPPPPTAVGISAPPAAAAPAPYAAPLTFTAPPAAKSPPLVAAPVATNVAPPDPGAFAAPAAARPTPPPQAPSSPPSGRPAVNGGIPASQFVPPTNQQAPRRPSAPPPPSFMTKPDAAPPRAPRFDFDVPAWRSVLDRVRTSNGNLAVSLESVGVMAFTADRVELGYEAHEFHVIDLVTEASARETLAAALRAHFGRGPELIFSVTTAKSGTVSQVLGAEKRAKLDAARRGVAEHPLVTAAIELLGAELRDVKLSAEAES